MRRLVSNLRILALSLGAWAVLGSTAAMGGLLPVDASISPAGSVYQYSYSVDLTSDSTLSKGDYFVIYNFNGYVAGSNQQPTGWTESISSSGPVPPGTAPSDPTGGTNVVFTYTGSTPLNGSITLGTFTVDSTLGGTTTGTFASLTQRTVDGVNESNITSTDCPVPNSSCPSSTPEPASLLLLGMAIPLAGLTRWMRRKD